ncbi:S8 family serine peptidase [Zavarzinella formosa]|uniref:S8 family serine peptidase n=1 Tax=Zavarzinella formosa TaxID=360055 RepID=UPI00030D49F2|nr:S8 family serine peptidase [Zavarzinella formosa]
MTGKQRSRIRLGLEYLETREQPSASPTQLNIDTTSYDPDHVIVKWKDGLAHASSITTASDALGNGQFNLTLDANVSVTTAVNYFKGLSTVEFAQPDYKVQIENLPNDPSFGNLWGLNNTGQDGGTANADINAPEAWNTNTGSGKMIVAVIDSGIDYTHPDLAANMWKNPKEVAGNGKDDDGNGYKDDIYGWNFVNNTPNVMDDNGHGTHVAGIIGAVGDNGIGVAGVNWHVQLMALKFLDKDGSGYMSNAVKALNYAVANGAKVVNNSYAGGGSDPAMQAAIAAAKAKGVIFVAAAGNDGTSDDINPVYPANYNSDNVVTVAATDRNDKLASYSNFGRNTVEIAAPGSNIYSTLPGNKYGVYSGTSMAAPEVTGAIALVWDTHPTWTYSQVINAILKTADILPSLTGKVATGRLDVGAAINYSISAPITTITPLTVSSAAFNDGSSLSSVRVTFNQTIDPTTFTAADITFLGPDGKAIAIKAVTAVSGMNNTQFDVTFAAQKTLGTYRLTLGTAIKSKAGKLLDQDGDGIAGETTDGFTVSTSLAASQLVTSTDVNKLIADNAKTISTIKIDGSFTISDVNVQLNITHPQDKDLKISLLGPDGTRVYLINQRGGTGANLTNTVFDDDASQKITAASAPFTGTYKPETALSQFKGKLAKGTWQLIIEDVNKGNSGRLNSWSLNFNSTSTASVTPVISSPVVTNQRKFLSPAPLLDASFVQAENQRKNQTTGT